MSDETVHQLGPAIFVFVGGTCATFATLAADADTLENRAAKKSDFISRLRGFMDVLGPNPAVARAVARSRSVADPPASPRCV